MIKNGGALLDCQVAPFSLKLSVKCMKIFHTFEKVERFCLVM